MLEANIVKKEELNSIFKLPNSDLPALVDKIFPKDAQERKAVKNEIESQLSYFNKKEGYEKEASTISRFYTLYCWKFHKEYKPILSNQYKKVGREVIHEALSDKDRKERQCFKGIESLTELNNLMDEVVKATGSLIVSPFLIYKHKKNGCGRYSNVSGNPEWYTPPDIIESARQTMGSIDLDPASCEKANEIVKAKKFYTKEDNGLDKTWAGNIFMNPPYNKGIIDQFISKVESEYNNYTQLIAIINNTTETKCGQLLIKLSDVICFPKGRVNFYKDDPHAENTPPIQGQMIVGVKVNIKKFADHFSNVGECKIDLKYMKALKVVNSA